MDWVSKAITLILERDAHHGRSFHLVSREPTQVRLIKEVAEEVLGIGGVSWAGPDGPADPTSAEELFVNHLQDYWPYRLGDPDFDCRNTDAVLPELPAPRIGLLALRKLIEFAVADDWGRRRTGRTAGALPPRETPRGPGSPRDYVERFFPEAVRHSALADVPLDVTLGLEVRGPAGGTWCCRWEGGELVSVERGAAGRPEVVYRLDPPVFEAVVAGRRAVHEAFMAREVEIDGDVEKGLKLAVLFERFVLGSPYPAAQEAREEDALLV